MNFDQLGPSWRDENEGVSAEERLERYVATARAVERFSEKVFRRDWLETIACLLVIGIFGSFLFDGETLTRAAMPKVSALGMIVIILGAAYDIYHLHRTRLSTPPTRLNATIREYCENELVRVEKQTDLLKSLPLWYFGPFYVGVTLIFLGSDGFCVEFVLSTVLVTLLYGSLYVGCRIVASTSQAAIRDWLVCLRDQLDAEGKPAVDPPDLSASEQAAKRYFLRLAAGALVVVCIGFAIGWWLDVDYPKRSPFDAVRWQDTTPEVRLGDDWFRLVSIDGVTTKEIHGFSRWVYGLRSRRHFEEDLVEVLTRMGHEPGETVTLVVSALDDDELITFENVTMSEEKRLAVKRAAMQREKERQGE